MSADARADGVIAGGVTTKAQGVAGRVLPDSLEAKAHHRMAEPGSGSS